MASASGPTEAQIAHQQLIEQLDIHSIHKNFRNPSWRPNQRRNKNLKAVVGEASRREASVMATPTGNATPPSRRQTANSRGADKGKDDDGLSTSGASTPANGSSNGNSNEAPNLAQASSSLSKLVLEKSLNNNNNNNNNNNKSAGGAATAAPVATYTNIESAPSLAHPRHYCDVTGLPAPYLDPKTRLRYHNKEIFGLIRSVPQSTAELYLEARGAHTVLK
ncbi:INO80 complex subunit C [Geosmithia morbida]|uniref:INO80 complex subunit C n=1 Tax=Geosmithia morbida TaxID=1094350 RepID=A0A9P5D8I2_9HYPO|nr:INO80 complex subunit C [Geosmithia morbida]KAF4126815.1 INO80 complex subunit C [Geosmithia morbida]